MKSTKAIPLLLALLASCGPGGSTNNGESGAGGPGGGYQDLWVSDINGSNAQSVPGTRELYWFDWTK